MAEIQNDQKPTIKIHGHEFEVTASEAEDFRRFRRRIRYLEINIKQERFDRERAVLMPSKEIRWIACTNRVSILQGIRSRWRIPS